MPVNIERVLKTPLLNEWIDSKYLNQRRIQSLRKSFSKKRPWPHLEMKRFFRKKKALILLEALKRHEFIKVREPRRTYNGTGDLKLVTERVLKECHAFFSSKEFMFFIRCLTGFRLTGQVLMEGRLYRKGHRVSVHSDYGMNYKLGFILYLTSLMADEGGRLRLLKKGRDFVCVKKVIPEFNKFALLIITPRSFHDVEPVFTTRARAVVCGMLGY